MSKQNKAVASKPELLVSFPAETRVLVEAKALHSEALNVVPTGCTMECGQCVVKSRTELYQAGLQLCQGLATQVNDGKTWAAVHSCAPIALPKTKVIVHASKVLG